MTARNNNPWIEVWVEQMWICYQAAYVVAKTMDSRQRLDPLARADRWLHPSEPRLNPLEFHGKRRSALPR